jgi:hypothetical protein
MIDPDKPNFSKIRDLLRQSRCESYLEDLNGQEEAYLAAVQRQLDRFCKEYENRFGEKPDIHELLRRNPEKGASFIQWVAGDDLSADITIMIWRILSGAEVLAVNYRYLKDQESFLEIELEPLPGNLNGPKPERYRSTAGPDFHLLSEFRMIGFNGKPYLVGSFRPVA